MSDDFDSRLSPPAMNMPLALAVTAQTSRAEGGQRSVGVREYGASSPRRAILGRRSSMSMSFMLASLRVLHIDISHAPAMAIRLSRDATLLAMHRWWRARRPSLTARKADCRGERSDSQAGGDERGTGCVHHPSRVPPRTTVIHRSSVQCPPIASPRRTVRPQISQAARVMSSSVSSW